MSSWYGLEKIAQQNAMEATGLGERQRLLQEARSARPAASVLTRLGNIIGRLRAAFVRPDATADVAPAAERGLIGRPVAGVSDVWISADVSPYDELDDVDERRPAG